MQQEPQLLGLSRISLFEALNTDPIRYEPITRSLDITTPIKAFNKEQDHYRTLCTLHVVIVIEDLGPVHSVGDSPESLIFFLHNVF